MKFGRAFMKTVPLASSGSEHSHQNLRSGLSACLTFTFSGEQI